MKGDYWTVTILNDYIKSKLSKDSQLKNVNLKGELSNFSTYPSGHSYFSIKDENSVIPCVMFNSRTRLKDLKPSNGMKVLANGRVDVYPPHGKYQFYVFNMSEEGEGDLYRKFEKLKKKLKEEGLFEKETPIPKYPKKIGVITSPKGAVIHDIITTIKRRWPYIEIILWPTMVQGDDAKISVSRNINLANETDVDLLIVCRGGGSIEDLWCFNEEIVAKAIFNSKIPIISAVGHESDTTIADFVADRRAPTPTAAAELTVPNVFEIRNQLINNEIRLNKTILNQIEYLENNLNRIKENHLIVNPIKLYETKTEKLDILWERLNRAMKNYMKTEVKNLSSLNEKLILLNPLGTIERGYSVVKDSKSDKIISSVKNLNIGDNINIELKDGYIKTNIDDIKEK